MSVVGVADVVTGWYVVKFIEENTLEVIPSNWLVNFKQCLWPSKLGSLKTQLAIKNLLLPTKDWEIFPVKVISKSLIGSFEEASKYANNALQLSSSENDVQTLKMVEVHPTKRKRVILKIVNKKRKDESSSENEGETDGLIPEFPSKLPS